MHRRAGFTLIELMAVVAIIVIIAAIAIPNLLRARIAANEVQAISNIRLLTTGQLTFLASRQERTPSGEPRYALGLGELHNPPAGGPPIIDAALASGQRSGYSFTCAGQNAQPTFTASARPSLYGITGVRSFFADQTYVIRYTNANAEAGPGSPPLG